jgi:CubicO group peptidase (beta-lactamase class C family)
VSLDRVRAAAGAPDGPLTETVPAARAITTRDLLTFTFGFGMIPGMFETSWLVDPAHDLAVIVCAQRPPESPELPPVHRDIQAAVYAALG